VSFFESWEQVDMLEADLGDWGPLAILAVGTGMVQQEWTALERRDIDLRDRVVTVRRFVVNRRSRSWRHGSRSDVSSCHFGPTRQEMASFAAGMA
jgi:hypothetical protein